MTFADEFEIEGRLWASGHGVVAVSTWQHGKDFSISRKRRIESSALAERLDNLASID